MKIIIDSTAYVKIKNLTFAPEADLTGNTLPVGELRADIVSDTLTSAAQGGFAELRGDDNTLWAKYWIYRLYRTDAHTARLIAYSPLYLIQSKVLPAVMYSAETIDNVLSDIFESLDPSGVTFVINDYTVDSTLSGMEVSGFCPEQNARDRLQWVCLACGAYVRDWFTDHLMIMALPDSGLTSANSGTLIPADKTFWRPELETGNTVTGASVKSYSFTQTGDGVAPQAGDATVTDDNGDVYIQTETEEWLSNTNASGIPPSNVKIDGVTIVASNNAPDVLANLGRFNFNNARYRLDAIDAGEYKPGDKVMFYDGSMDLFRGYVQSCEFRFGFASRARMTILAPEAVPSAKLTVLYMYGDIRLGQEEYTLPVGYAYSIPNPVIYREVDGVTQECHPLLDNAEGTIVSGENVNTQYYEYEALPEYISVTTLPNKTAYLNGETIVYTGLVVKAYDKNGNLYTSSSYPNGIIPISELTLPVTEAEYTGVQQSYIGSGTYKINSVGSILDTIDYGLTLFNGTAISNGIIEQVKSAVAQYDGVNPGFVRVYCNAPQGFGGWSPFDVNVFTTVSEGDTVNFGPDYSYGILHVDTAGRGGDGTFTFSNYGVSSAGANIFAGQTTANRSVLVSTISAELLLSGTQTIPVQWPRLGSGKILETEFSIDVSGS